MTSAWPADTGNPSSTANAKSFDAIHADDGISENGDTVRSVLRGSCGVGRSTRPPACPDRTQGRDASDPYERATKVRAVNGAEIDVPDSQIVRVQLGHLGASPDHFIDSICDVPAAAKRDPGGHVERRSTRMKHNILPDLYEDEEGQLVDRQRNVALGI
jgi:hypothetical protein